jgi:hypothetical protein
VLVFVVVTVTVVVERRLEGPVSTNT